MMTSLNKVNITKARYSLEKLAVDLISEMTNSDKCGDHEQKHGRTSVEECDVSYIQANNKDKTIGGTRSSLSFDL